MKSKFQNFDFGAVEVLSREEAAKVKGGAYGAGVNILGYTQYYYATGAPGGGFEPGTGLPAGPGICYDSLKMPYACGTSNGPRS